MRVTLRNDRDGASWSVLESYRHDSGELCVYGQNLGKDYEYEYGFTFSEANEKRLLKALAEAIAAEGGTATGSIFDDLKAAFDSGLLNSATWQDFLQDRTISYEFWSRWDD